MSILAVKLQKGNQHDQGGSTMSPATIDLINRALELPVDERAEMIEMLKASIAQQPALHPAWEAEIARRVAEMDRGETVFVDADEVMRQVRATIRTSRKKASRTDS
jgi:putative addiction module component (TIGR02574 family)